jgi:hypothetical protein
MKYKYFWYAFIMVLLLAVLPYCPFFNKTGHINKDVKLLNSEHIFLEYFFSRPRYIGHPHIIDFTLGYDFKDVFSWEVNGKKYNFKTNYRVFIIEKYKNVFYIATLDSKTNIRHSEFRFFKEDGNGWAEINFKDFPKEIAYQNVSISNKPIMSRELDYKDLNFNISLTGYLWVLLECGNQYFEQKEFNQEFYLHFYEKHLLKKDNGVEKSKNEVH